jgi:hypothetical protein
MANIFKEPDLTTERGKHLNWCKTRAFEYLDRGDITNAWASFTSDMMKNNETKDHIALNPIMAMMSMGSVREMREFINGFN